jgi:peptide/nickel transport system permease protein
MIIRYLVIRSLTGVALLLVASMLIFALVEVLPGDSVLASLAGGIEATPAQIEAKRQELGLDKPMVERYADWLGGVVQGDFGTSFSTQRPVSEMISERIGNTLLLAGIAFALIVPLSIVLGILAGTREGGRLDRVLSSLSLGLIATPEFVLGALLILLFSFVLSVLPPVSLVALGQSPLDQPEVLILPVLTLTLIIAARAARFVRVSVADVMRCRYVEMARLNGVRERRVIGRHVLPNALAPAVQVFAGIVGLLAGGSVVVETLFRYPGMGAMLPAAVADRDLPLVEGVAVVVAAFFIVAIMLADLILVLITPKLRTRR